VKLTAAAASLRKSSGTDLAGIVNQVFGESDAWKRLPAAEVEAAWVEGAAMSCEAAVDFALRRGEPG
jgi:hypothetical protein